MKILKHFSNYLFFLNLLALPVAIYGVYTYPFDVPSHKLKEIETEHFRVIFSPNSISNAIEISQIAEEEFDSLTEYYGTFQTKDEKIRVIVSDDYQEANGFASLLGYPVIHLYTSVPPSISDSHSYTERQHLRTLIRHELSHIFTIAFRISFKNRLADNISEDLVMPAVFGSRSFLEGSAVARESDHNYGRLNDPYTYHLARRTLLDNQFPSFAQIGGADTSFGSGSNPYIYGALLNKFVSENINPNTDNEFWHKVARWNISSLAIKHTTKSKSLHQLWTSFKDHLISNTIPYETNHNLLLSNKKRRIHSVQKRKNKIYYFDSRSKELRYYNSINKKDYLAAYGNNSWDKVSVSYDEKSLLVSGSTQNKKFVIILDKKTLTPISKSFQGLKDARFMRNSTKTNPQFLAIHVNSSYPELLLVSNSQSKILYKGNSLEYFDSPVCINDGNVYFLHSYNSHKRISRINLKSGGISSLENPALKFPRFLTEDDKIISVSYARHAQDFYKRALLKDNQLLMITNNIKGEMFDSVIEETNIIYKTSFSKNDNLNLIPLNSLTMSTQQARFNNIAPLKPTILENFDGTITAYRIDRDLIPLIWIPFVNFQRAGISTLIVDSTGANEINVGVNIYYYKATPEFSFQWVHKSLPINISLSAQDLYMSANKTMQLGQHILVTSGLGLSYSTILNRLTGSISFNSCILWQGRFTGDINQHPFTWHHLSIQQLVNVNSFSWRHYTSEGKHGFYRSIGITFQNKIDFLHTYWYNFEGHFSFSPPIIPIKFNLYASYDTSSISTWGISLLGQSLIPCFHEYRSFSVFSPYVVFGSIDLMLYSWEIQNGPGFGELFFNRWKFSTGYRGGTWGEKAPYIDSVYLRTEIEFSLLYGIIPFNFFLEGNYAITIDKLGYNYGIITSVSF